MKENGKNNRKTDESEFSLLKSLTDKNDRGDETNDAWAGHAKSLGIYWGGERSTK
jgi:hypothetical protein